MVTENASGKIFVHESESGGVLENLLYTAKAEKNGYWTVYDSSGERLGSIKRPRGENIKSAAALANNDAGLFLVSERKRSSAYPSRSPG